MAPKRSQIWSFYTVIDDNKAKCNFCKEVQSTKSGSTGNLLRHCRAMHPSIPLPLPSSKRPVNPANEDEHLSDAGFEVVDSDVVVVAETGSSETGSCSATSTVPVQSVTKPVKVNKHTKQSLIKQFSHKTISKSNKIAIDNALLKFVVTDLQAFSVVDCDSFQKLVGALNPSYNLPTRKTLSNSMLSSQYAEIYGKVKLSLDKAKYVCITTDAWTSRNNDAYIAVTCHFIDIETEALKTVLLSCFITTERHTAINLEKDLRLVLEEWKLLPKVVAIVSDNAANIVCAVENLKKTHISCFAHTLNLAVQDGLEVVKDLHSKVKDIVSHFKRSTVAANELAKTQTEKKQELLKVKQSTPTRWNSSLHMFQRFIQVNY